MEQAVLFSALDGHVVKDGAPLAGATLVREWAFAQDGVRSSDKATTDAAGHFQFPAVLHAWKKPRFLAQQIIVDQMIWMDLEGRRWVLWDASKPNLDAGTEVRQGPGATTPPEQPLAVVIDLDAPAALSGRVFGHTRFKAQP